MALRGWMSPCEDFDVSSWHYCTIRSGEEAPNAHLPCTGVAWFMHEGPLVTRLSRAVESLVIDARNGVGRAE